MVSWNENKQPLETQIHQLAIEQVYKYLLVGDMPEAVEAYIDSDHLLESRISSERENTLLGTMAMMRNRSCSRYHFILCRLWQKTLQMVRWLYNLNRLNNPAERLCVLRNGRMAHRKFALPIPSEGSIIAVIRLGASGGWTAAGRAAAVAKDARYERSNRC